MKKQYSQSKQAVKNEMFLTGKKNKTSNIFRNLVWLFYIVIGFSNTLSYSQTIGANCASAPTLLVNTQYTTLTNITDATVSDPSEAACNTQTIVRDGWIKFVAVGSQAIVTVTSTDRNPILYGYTGACGAFSTICTNVTAANGAQTETLTFTGLTSGNTYYVRIGNATANNMTISSLFILSNDRCSTAITLTSNTSCVNTTGSTLGATDNNETGDCTDGSENAVWYQFQAVATTHVVTVDGIAGFNPVLGVTNNCGSTISPTGGACINITGDDGIETRTLTGLSIGAFYRIQVYDFNGDLTANGFTICVTHTVPTIPPTITSFTPSIGCATTGTVVLTGTNFTGATAVTIGGTPVTSFIVNSATQITAIVGNGTTGTIAVTTASGTATSLLTFTINPLPVNPGNPTSNSPQCSTPGVTLTRVGSVPVGETWYWQTIPLGTAITNSAATNVVTTSGTYYIRALNSTGCWSAASGSVTVVVNTVPTASITPTPANAATGICFSGSGAITGVSWDITAGATSYDVYFGAGSLPGTLTANVLTNSYTTGTLLANTTYYWRVVAKNTCGNAVGSSTWTFTTSAVGCYCSSTSTTPTYFIEDFSTTGGFSNISNINSGYSATGCGNFTTQTVSQVNNGSVNFLTDFNGNLNSFGFNIWVDWNNDGDFNDAGELVYASGAFVTGVSGSFAVPATASIGNHRMRIRANYLATNPSACGAITNGETEEYTFTVSPPLLCSGNPSGITVLLNSQTTSTVSWTAASPAPANGYQYYLFTSNAYPTGVTGSTAAGVTSVNLTGLTSATTYYIWVRSNCGGGLGQGVWIGPTSFTQPNCALGNGTGTTTLGCPSITSGGFGLNDVNPPAIDCTTSGCANLEATYLQVGDTSNYTVAAIPYAPPYQFNCLRNPISVNIDDVWSPVINLPFNFCYYGNSYSSCVVGSNGVISFNTNLANTNSGWAFSNNLPSTTGALFANTIYGVYHDIDPSKGGKVGWELITLNTGCRALVASWNDVPMFSNNTILYTGMMVLYENTNVIEVYIKQKGIDNFDISPWNGGNAIVGLQNATGTAAVVAPGRNALDTNWEVPNEAWRFTPSGPSIASLKWYEGSGTTGPVVGTTPILTVCPTATTIYTAEVTYTLCNGNTVKETDEAIVTVTNGKKWDGSVSTDWNVAANWTPAGVPTLLDCVVIPNVTNDPIISGTSFNAFGLNLTVLSGATLQINATNTLTLTDFIEVEPTASLTVKNSASLIQVNDFASNTGNIIMERSTTIRKTDYVYWSTPVENFSSAAISPGTSSGYIYKWNPTIANTNGGEGNWVSGNETMATGRGYIVRGPNTYTATPTAFTATFTGKPNNGIITAPISRGNRTTAMGSIPGVNGVTITPNDDNFNLIGNPYPSAIDALSFLTANTNIIGNVSIWTHGTPISPTAADPFYANYVNNYTVSDYINYNGTGSTPPGYNGKIASGQGFFVIMNDGTAATQSVTFNNSLRRNTYTNNQFYRTNSTTTPEEVETDKNRIWLSLINTANVSVTTLVGYVPDATYENDRLFDAPSKIGTAMGIYSMINDKSMIIQGRPIPFDQNDVVPLAISIPSSGNYTIAIGLVDGLFENDSQEIYLEDTQLGIIHNLRVAPYSFEGTAGIFETRFKLRYTTSALGTGNFNSNQTFAFINNNMLQIQSNQNITEVAIYEVSGKLVKTYKSNQLVNHLESEFNFSTGVYLAKIKLESGIFVSKKLINK